MGAQRTPIADTAQEVLDRVEAGGRAVAARVVELAGFSTWPGDELVVVDDAGALHGQVLGAAGSSALRQAAGRLLATGEGVLGSVVIEIHGDAVAENGLACGGRAELVLQPVATIPGELWARLARRAPVALVTPLAGDGQPAASVVVTPDGAVVGGPGDAAGVAEAAALLGQGRGGTSRVESEYGPVLVEAWVPDPRPVVVGGGDLVAALGAQAGLLGWEVRAVATRPDAGGDDLGAPGVGPAWPDLEDALAWAGASAALVVLSHDPHLDVPAIGAALDAGVPYIGAMGSRRTQSRRLDRLRASGRTEAELASIHRPIGLDLGGRSAPQLALSICAEILAVHCGRDGAPLSQREGPIHDRPAVAPGR